MMIKRRLLSSTTTVKCFQAKNCESPPELQPLPGGIL